MLLGKEQSVLLGKMGGHIHSERVWACGQRGEDPRACSGRVGVPQPFSEQLPAPLTPTSGREGLGPPHLHAAREDVCGPLPGSRASTGRQRGWKFQTGWMCQGRGHGGKNRNL